MVEQEAGLCQNQFNENANLNVRNCPLTLQKQKHNHFNSDFIANIFFHPLPSKNCHWIIRLSLIAQNRE